MTKTDFPPDLRTKLPSIIYALYFENRRIQTVITFSWGALLIYGPIGGQPDHNGFRYLLAPLLCPMASAILSTLRPFTPFNISVALLSGTTRMNPLGPQEMRLIELYRSKEAQRFIKKTAVKISGMLYLLAAITIVATRKNLYWSITSRFLVPGFVGGFMGAYFALQSEYIGWGLRTWAQRELKS